MSKPRRSAVVRQSRKQAGLPPGTLLHTGDSSFCAMDVELFRFNKGGVEYSTVERSGLTKLKVTENEFCWLDVCGLSCTDAIRDLGVTLGISSLVLEDVLHTQHHPKLEELDDGLFLILKIVTLSEDRRGLDVNHLAIFLNDRWVVSFHDAPTKIFDPLKERLRKPVNKHRTTSVDMMLYSLVDAVVDNYVATLDSLSEFAAELNEKMLEKSSIHWLEEVHSFKHQMVVFRLYAWPVKDMVTSLVNSTSEVIGDVAPPYFKDVLDHVSYLVEEIKIQEEQMVSLQNVYLALVNYRTAHIMRVLTVLAALFMPITFVTGIYGMNFRFMPELNWEFGYPLVLALIMGIIVFLYVLFRRRGWLDDCL